MNVWWICDQTTLIYLFDSKTKLVLFLIGIACVSKQIANYANWLQIKETVKQIIYMYIYMYVKFSFSC